ncbi:MAG: hypothetical protein LBN21_07165 [Treponema sp.]|nr:hypothetical protein [Treponema sp.]
MKKTFLLFGIGILMIGLVVGCASGPKEPKAAKAGKSGSAQVGPDSILQNPAHPDGKYDIPGGISVQFLGEDWIQSADGTPVFAGKLSGVPNAPTDVTYDKTLTPAEQEDQAKAFFAAVQPKVGDLSLKPSSIVVGGKTYTLDEGKAQIAKAEKAPELGGAREKALLAAKPISDAIADAEKQSLDLHYVITDNAPYITVTKK